MRPPSLQFVDNGIPLRQPVGRIASIGDAAASSAVLHSLRRRLAYLRLAVGLA